MSYPWAILLWVFLAKSDREISRMLWYFRRLEKPMFARADHYNDVIMNTMASQITSLSIVYSTVYSGKDQRKYQSSATLAFVWGIHRGPVNSPHKRPVTRKMSPFDDVIMPPALVEDRIVDVDHIVRCHYKYINDSQHDDVIKWKHFPRNCPFVRGIHLSRWIPHTKASDAELWCFLWSASE